MCEPRKDVLSFDFDRRLKAKFVGPKVTGDVKRLCAGGSNAAFGW